ncbi:MAG: PspC domain-containing protein [Lactobacillaceae bacterium]|jgi:phage shock protein C|nr:PspC domain-containing protein [Lactobacillaceae bacterium]
MKLYKRRDNKIIFGVAAGVADFFKIDVDLVRIIWVLLAIFTWSGMFWVYLILGIVLPYPSKEEVEKRAQLNKLKEEYSNKKSKIEIDDEIEDLQNKIADLEKKRNNQNPVRSPKTSKTHKTNQDK